jgi:hypothetical protein
MPRIRGRGTLEHWQHFLPFMEYGLIAIGTKVNNTIDLILEGKKNFTFAQWYIGIHFFAFSFCSCLYFLRNILYIPTSLP